MYHNMFQGHINGPVMVEEGAVYTGKGKFRLQFLGSSNPKELTGRIAIVAAVLVLAVLLAATLLAGRDPSAIPYEMKLLNSIGQPLENALANIGLTTAELTEIQPDAYAVDADVKVDGVYFKLQLHMDGDVLCGFTYTAEYEADVRKAAKDIYNISYAIGLDETEPIEIGRKAMLEHLNQGEDIVIEPGSTNVTPAEPTGGLKRYLETLESADDWEGNVHGYLVKRAQVYLDRSIAYVQDTHTVKMQISYSVAADRENK